MEGFKIYYIVDCVIGAKGNGVLSQALIWADILLKFKSQKVILVNPWEKYDYKKGDIIHLFGSSGVWFYDVAKKLVDKGCHVIWSPICDNIDSPRFQHIKSLIGSERLQVYSFPMIRRKAFAVVNHVFARSEYEKKYLIKAYGINSEKIIIVPLSISYDNRIDVELNHRERFCLHISSIYQERKNVIRLIKAAKKYQFRLVLAGNKGSAKQFEFVEKEVHNSNNIDVLGFISEEEKIALYSRAKTFALPSIMEGVGIVALDAAYWGCEIVMTDIGGPKEYYDGMAYLVNPFDIDSIGKAIITSLNNKSGFQPHLHDTIWEKYSQIKIADTLYKAYLTIKELS